MKYCHNRDLINSMKKTINIPNNPLNSKMYYVFDRKFYKLALLYDEDLNVTFLTV